MFVIDSIAREIRDPLIISHWNVLNSPTLSCVKIIIMTHGYDTLQRTALVVHVGEKTLKCICRDGRVLQMSYEPQELRDLILCQVNPILLWILFYCIVFLNIILYGILLRNVHKNCQFKSLFKLLIPMFPILDIATSNQRSAIVSAIPWLACS